MLSFMVIINSFLIVLSHPLTIGLTLIAQTLLIAMTTNYIMGQVWFSYLLVLVFLGGLLILFIYVATLASNEQLNMKLPMKNLVIFTGAGLVLAAITPMTTLTSTDNFLADPISFLYINSFIIMASLILCYLFIVLVAVVKITKFWSGSLRPLN